MDMIEITPEELMGNLDSDDFCRRFGNPVKVRTENGYIVVMAFELYERLFGKVDLSKEHTIEIDEFLRKSKETEKKDDKPD